MTRLTRRHLLGGGALILAGCASPPVNSYRLAAIPMAVQPAGPLTIAVRGIGIPGYLDQSGIVKAAGPYQFDTYDNDVWAAPLAAMLQAVMVQDLAQILPNATVLASGGAIDAPARLLVEINVETFDPDGGGNMALLTQVAIKDGTTHALLHTATLHLATPAAPGAMGTAAAMSQLWAQAAGQIAGLIIS